LRHGVVIYTIQTKSTYKVQVCSYATEMFTRLVMTHRQTDKSSAASVKCKIATHVHDEN